MTSELVQKTGLLIFSLSTRYKQKFRIQNVQINHLDENLLLAVKNSR